MYIYLQYRTLTAIFWQQSLHFTIVLLCDYVSSIFTPLWRIIYFIQNLGMTEKMMIWYSLLISNDFILKGLLKTRWKRIYNSFWNAVRFFWKWLQENTLMLFNLPILAVNASLHSACSVQSRIWKCHTDVP